MRFIGLISGGKDSVYHLHECVALGHSLVALANLTTEHGEDANSWMFQTVGTDWIQMIAQSLGVPVYQKVIKGSCYVSDLHYRQKDSRDEVEDLLQLLESAKAATGADSVASGAILSDYQRYRVENVCRRLGLTSLSLLWQREAHHLLKCMWDCGMQAVMVRIAGGGLDESMLGRSVQEAQGSLVKAESRFGINVAGEGGEYDTLALDAPLYASKIIIEDGFTRMEDEFTGVFTIAKARLQPKGSASSASWKQSILESERVFAKVAPPAIPEEPVEERIESIVVSGESSEALVTALRDSLRQRDLDLARIAFVHMIIPKMSDFASLNRIYHSFVDQNLAEQPPGRSCVATSAQGLQPYRLAAVITPCEINKMHVESVSYWAPANVGPYSQTASLRLMTFVSGQIGLRPETMTIEQDSEESRSLMNVQRVLAAKGLTVSHTVMATLFLTSSQLYGEQVRQWGEAVGGLKESGSQWVFGVVVAELPRQARVEWEVAVSHLPVQWRKSSETLFETSSSAVRFFGSASDVEDAIKEGWFSDTGVAVKKLFIQAATLPRLLEHSLPEDLFVVPVESVLSLVSTEPFVAVATILRGQVHACK